MALRRYFGFSEGELMRSDCKPCSRLMRHTAGIFSVGALRWAACGAVTVSSSTAMLVRLFSPECEPLNIAAFEKPA
ncbi:unnamed protein product [Linum tenue]|uniref:DUF7875 domain-containing protein n=1 Tax=Linum tenue TaxID=586396 RepID=A0AAV0R045_9ROSI|nr:unnamed protein product [Linum tenue]